MCNTCGYYVDQACITCAQRSGFSQPTLHNFMGGVKKLCVFQVLYNFYTHVFTQSFRIFSSVIHDLYTFYTRLIITKTNTIS